MVELLAPKNADIDSKSKALFDAVEQDDLEKVKQLIKDGADVNVVTDYGESALIAALGDKKAEIAKVLIAAGADVFCEDELGKTAMELAIAMGDVEIFQALVKKGIKVIPKHLAYAIEDGQVQLIKPMYQLSPMIRWSVEHGPYLRLAAEKGNSLCALYLLFLGAKLDARGARQKTAEQIARESGNTHLANLLKTYPQKVQTLKNKILKKVFFDDIEVPRNYPKLLLQWCGN